MTIAVYIAFEPRAGEPVTLARISGRAALISAAETAIAESRARIEELSREDPILGELQSAETDRLSRALRCVLPELKGDVVQ
ncbi:MAG TPA: hypothetical protein VGN17_30695 [Bryobacteraceae bacterium]|jgi:hypothetical protein